MNPNAMHLPDGTLLAGGKYRIVRFIGAGGFGCTYEAEFVPMGSRVAIKEFFVSACCNRDATGAVSVGIQSQKGFVGKLEEKFRREAKRLFNLKYPGIVGVSDILEENGTSYYVMDYIAGRSLQQIIEDEGPLSEARAVRYIGQVMDALEYVHNKNMLHLDIKPDNIMVDVETDRAILIDFGVSKQYDEADGHNTSTIMGHTPGYAPPEQAGNSIRQFTPAADIYALGATLYTLLTGNTPPSSTDLVSESATLAPLPPTASPAMYKAIAAMMQPGVSRRPQNIVVARRLLNAGGIENGKLQMENSTADTVGIHTVPVAPTPAETKTAPRHTPPKPGETAPLTSGKPSRKKWLWAAIAAAAIAIGVVAILLLSKDDKSVGSTTIAEDSVMLACVYKPTGEQRFFTYSEWSAVSDTNDYMQLGVGVNFDGQQFIVARTDAGEAKWAENDDNDVPGLLNIDWEDNSVAKLDFDGQGNTNKIINAISTNGIAYPAASAARDYKAATGDYTKWSLPAAGQLWLIFEHRQAINDELAKYGMTKISEDWYWSSTEGSSAYAWFVGMTIGYISTYTMTGTGRVRAVAPVLVPAVPAK